MTARQIGPRRRIDGNLVRQIGGKTPERELRIPRRDKLLKRKKIVESEVVTKKQGLGLEAEPLSMLDESGLSSQPGSGSFRIKRFNRRTGLALTSTNRYETTVQFTE